MWTSVCQMNRLTGKATDMMVASKAQARLTIAMEVKAARSRHPGLNFSTSSEFEFADGSSIFSILSGCATSCLVESETAGASISIPWAHTVRERIWREVQVNRRANDSFCLGKSKWEKKKKKMKINRMILNSQKPTINKLLAY